MNNNPVALCAVGVIAALGLGACGSGSSSSGLSRSQIDAKANAICQSAQAKAKAVPPPSSVQDPKAAAAYFDKIAPITDEETKSLQALKPASDVSADYGSFMSAQQAANGLVQTIKQKADARDASGLKDLNQVQPAGQRVTAAATKAGAGTCAQ